MLLYVLTVVNFNCALGIGCTFGNAIYVLIGSVIANYAGPSIVLSFIIGNRATSLAIILLYYRT